MIIGIIIAFVVLASLLIYFAVRAELKFRKRIKKMEEEEEKHDHNYR